MSKKCGKTKNPCKICLGPVTQKNGLCCEGACKNWVHYTCLHYTPGKIKDIKAGLIKINCPCPDCKSTLPRETRTDLPYRCTNKECPANKPPRCHNNECPVNSTDNSQQKMPAASCQLTQCGTDCKTNSSPQIPSAPPPTFNTPCKNQTTPTITPNTSSDSQGDGERTNSPSVSDIEKMCNTVGVLTNQINQLMRKMQQTVNNGKGLNITKNTCPARGQKSGTKPCFCPGNPNR